jgi:hypothetical protein
VPLTPDVAFLSLFRGIAYEHYEKRAERVFVEALRSADAGRSLAEQGEHQTFVDTYIQGIEIALGELGEANADLNRRYFEKEFSGISALETTFDGVLPIAATFAFHPEFDFRGVRLQSLAYAHLQYMTVTTAVRDENTVVTFAWLGGFETPAGRLADSFRSLGSRDKATAFALFCFIHAENWHLRPSWWSALSTPSQDRIGELMVRGLPSDDGLRLAEDYDVASSPFRIENEVSNDQALA